MNYANIFYDDSKNGHGFRTTLVCTGCDLNPHCKNCFNSSIWDFNTGQPFTEQTKQDILDSLSKEYILGISIIGGDPISNVKRDNTLTDLVKTVKQLYKNKTIYVWSGYKFENIYKIPEVKEFLKYIDMLRDGRYIPELRNIQQYLQGSTNQRYIDVQSSLKQGKVIEFEEFKKR